MKGVIAEFVATKEKGRRTSALLKPAVTEIMEGTYDVSSAIRILLRRGSNSISVPTYLRKSLRHALFKLLAFDYKDPFTEEHEQAVLKLIGSQPLEIGSRRYLALRGLLEWSYHKN